MDETTVTSGVEAIESSEPVAAEQETVVDQNTAPVEESTETPKAGVAENPVAAEQDKNEVAFAKRLAAERDRIAQQARDAWVAEQNYSWNGKPIKTEAEYKQAVREQELIKSLEGQNVPQEIIEELVAGRQDRETLKQVMNERALEKRIDADMRAFKQSYPDVDPNTISDDVWGLIEQSQGALTLLDAYNRLEMPKRMAQLQEAVKVKETNEKNAGTSPGSVTGNGATQQQYFSKEQVESMSKADVARNLDAILESQRRW